MEGKNHLSHFCWIDFDWINLLIQLILKPSLLHPVPQSIFTLILHHLSPFSPSHPLFLGGLSLSISPTRSEKPFLSALSSLSFWSFTRHAALPAPQGKNTLTRQNILNLVLLFLNCRDLKLLLGCKHQAPRLECDSKGNHCDFFHF